MTTKGQKRPPELVARIREKAAATRAAPGYVDPRTRRRLEAQAAGTWVDPAVRYRETRLQLTPQVAALATRLAELEERVAALEARPIAAQIVEWKPNHRRIVDGGIPVSRQRKAAGL